MTDRELMQQALEALKLIDDAMPFPVAKLAMKNLRERLAQPEQEPVPPQRKAALTRGQIREIEVDVSLNLSFDYITPAEQLCRAIEAAHGIKENT